IRGYEYGVLRGDNSFLARYEIRLPINFASISDINNTSLPLDFNLFIDTGTCWNNDSSLSKGILHSGFGCSINIISPDKGVLRIGCMWNRKSTGKFYLDIGMDF
ncbi:BamA/TamA family outer membrane protein, partial [bacterium]|nr:BamA/TamA family outer membrane protein [bacterium]